MIRDWIFRGTMWLFVKLKICYPLNISDLSPTSTYKSFKAYVNSKDKYF